MTLKEPEASPWSNIDESSLFYDKIFLELARSKNFDYRKFGETKISVALSSDSLKSYFDEYINVANELSKHEFLIGFTRYVKLILESCSEISFLF